MLNSVLSEKKLNEKPQQVCGLEQFVAEGERILRLGNSSFGISDIKQQWHIPE